MRIPASFPRHALEPVDEDRAFRLTSGGAARSLADLAGELRRAPSGAVWFHREHFVPWVRDVVGDEPLARRMDAYARSGADPDVLRDVLADLVSVRVEELRRAAASR